PSPSFVHAIEPVEHLLPVSNWNAWAVVFDLNCQVFRLASDPHVNRCPDRRELYGVVNDIDQHLPKKKWVRRNLKLFITFYRQLKGFFLYQNLQEPGSLPGECH